MWQLHMEFGIKSVRLTSSSKPRASHDNHPIPSLGFVNAQCRFVMNPLGDYTVHFADPDMCVTQSFIINCLDVNRLLVVSSNGKTYYR
jgi:hypothetical protein